MNRGIDADVQERMNAYRGNPQALMQRYAQSQQLVDLLALQKLKSDKEAATRQMQMQMGQEGLPTIAQQREQEVMDMTKQEVAQRVGGVGQQQAQQQQQNLQQAMQGGIAQAPSPNIAQFKEGGIVGYAGPSGSVVANPDVMETALSLEQLRNEYNRLRSVGKFADATRIAQAIRAKQEAAPRTVTTPVAEFNPQIATPASVPAVTTPAVDKESRGLPPPTRTSVDKDISRTGLKPGVMPPGAPQGAEKAAPATGIAQALPGELGGAFGKAGVAALNPDLKAIGAESEAEQRRRFDPFFQEAIARKQAAIDESKQLEAREQSSRDPLTAFLLGAQGRTIGETLGSAGRNVADYQAKAIGRDRALMQERQKMLEELGAAKIAPEEKAYGAYQDAQKRAQDSQKGAMAPIGSYLTGMENAQTRAELAEARIKQIAAQALQEQSLTPAQITKARTDAAKLVAANVNAKTIEGFALRDKVDKGIITIAQLEAEQFARLVGEAAPNLQVATGKPAAAPTGQPVVKFDALKTGK